MNSDRCYEVQDDLTDTGHNSHPPATINCQNEGFKQIAEYKGDRMRLKTKDNIRIGFININGIPNSNQDAKNSDLREAINKGQFDCIGLAEVNRNWNKIPLQHKWHNFELIILITF